ncbi:MAG: hypothetical protein IKJ01_04765 [Lachnospiraceae bacterium]|nr:hypothetical protein [Lachnospiraceae bacterium]
MNISNRLYTYPILNQDKDDYKTSKFEVTVSKENSTVSSLDLKFKFTLINKEIRNLMLFDKSAEYVVHIECPTTSFRTIVTGDVSGEFSYQIPYKELNGKVEIVAFVLATKEIKNFSSIDWNEDFQGLTFDIPKGGILAFENLDDLMIIKDDQDLMNASSIFSIYKRNTDESKPAVVELNSPKIKIGLCTKEYNLYNKYAGMEETRILVNSLIVLPALVYVFEELRQEDNEETYKERLWYISLVRAYRKKGINLREVLMDETKTSYECAQEAMDLAINLALEGLEEIFTTSEGDSE